VYGGFWGAEGSAPTRLATVFASRAGQGAVCDLWPGPVGSVSDCRSVNKQSLVHNGATPRVELDAERQSVHVDGQHVQLEPVSELPLNRAYFLS
jgi:urease subunit alpha